MVINMKTLQISISPPITEWCTNCSYAKHYSFASMRIKCPECGMNSVKKGPKLHKAFYIDMIATNGLYQYTIGNLPFENSHIIVTKKENHECDCPFDTLKELILDDSIKKKILFENFIKFIHLTCLHYIHYHCMTLL